MEIFLNYFLYFIIYSFIGWSIEVIGKLIEFKRFVNRGYLIGPLCTIYGYGVLFIIMLIGETTGDFLSTFLKSILVCSLLEYLTSYFMEKIFHARWWDYSRRKFNLNGRICLETMIPFGVGGTFVVYIVHPLVKKLVALLSYNARLTIAIIILIVFLIDNLVSFLVLRKIKTDINKNMKDNTEEIRKGVMDWLDTNSILYTRLRNAYPTFISNIKKITDRVSEEINNAKDEIIKSKDEFVSSINDAKDEIVKEINNLKKR